MYVCWIHGPSKNYILGTRHLCLDLSFSFLAFSFGAESLYSLNFGFHICKMNTHYYLPGLFGGFMINKLLEIFVYTCCLQLLTSHSLLTHPYQTLSPPHHQNCFCWGHTWPPHCWIQWSGHSLHLTWPTNRIYTIACAFLFNRISSHMF